MLLRSFGACLALMIASTAIAQNDILQQNVTIFDGQNAELITGINITIYGQSISGMVATGGDESGFETVIDGGVSSFTAPLYVAEFIEKEIGTSVKGAEDLGACALAHSCSPRRIRGANKAKLALDGTDRILKWAKQYGVHQAWGADLLNGLETGKQHLKDLRTRTKRYDSNMLMIQAAGNGGATVVASGQRNPYGKVGANEKDAIADFLAYNASLIDQISIVDGFENSLLLCMTDGEIVKKTLN